MPRLNPWLYALAILLCLATPALAEVVDLQATGSAPYKGKKADDDTAKGLLEGARLTAVRRYLADTDRAKQRLFERYRDAVMARWPEFIIGQSESGKTDDVKAKKLSLSLTFQFDTNAFENVLGDLTGATETQGQGARIAVVFVARTPRSVQEFADHVYARADTGTKNAASGTLKAGITEKVTARKGVISDQVKGGYATTDTEDNTATQETGGSVTRRADVTDWAVDGTMNIETLMTDILTQGGLQVDPAAFIDGLPQEAIRRDFTHAGELSGATLRNLTAAVKASGAAYVAIGALDSKLPEEDPVSGAKRVYVTLNAVVYRLDTPTPRPVASVGPIDVFGVGPSGDSARTQGLKDAAEQAAMRIVDTLALKAQPQERH